MQIQVEWIRPVSLKDASRENMIYSLNLDRLPTHTGVYVFGRQYGKSFEALYVGKANRLRGRIKNQLNNVRLMQHLRNAKAGKRMVMAGCLRAKPGQRGEKCLPIIERALIRYFLSEGHDLVNMQGTRIRRHKVLSSGTYPRRLILSPMFVEQGKSS
jgi:hypothetical protein